MTNHWLDTLMERTIVPSFSRIGIRVRRRLFQWPTLDQYSLKGKVVVLTGATSGIGEAAAKRYAHLGATLVLVGRDQSKTDALATALANSSGNPDITTVIADLGVRQDVIELADTLLQQCPRIDVLVHNAGALFNQRRRAGNGLDLTVELMVVTPFLLTGRLLPSLQAAAPARVLTMSSGGMYTEPLTVESLEMA